MGIQNETKKKNSQNDHQRGQKELVGGLVAIFLFSH